jgi:hypothetical protein
MANGLCSLQTILLFFSQVLGTQFLSINERTHWLSTAVSLLVLNYAAAYDGRGIFLCKVMYWIKQITIWGIHNTKISLFCVNIIWLQLAYLQALFTPSRCGQIFVKISIDILKSQRYKNWCLISCSDPRINHNIEPKLSYLDIWNMSVIFHPYKKIIIW